MRGVLVLLLLLLLVACGRTAPHAPSAFETLKQDSDQVLARIAWLRQLPERRPTRLVFHDADDFSELVREQAAGGATPTSADHPAFQHAFGFAGIHGQGSDSLSNVQKQEVVAFFDESTFSVHVRADAGESADDSMNPAWVVAHEVGHSLQHQHFPIPDVASLPEDQRLAALAMLEGDAMLVMLAYASYEQHAPLARSVVRVQRAIQADEARQYRSITHSSAALDRAPSSVRERLVFPYLAGLGFMGSLYRTGGYPLVNRVYQRPPSTTEQVLHPEKYLAGEPSVSIEMPRLPPGYAPVASGSMGELQLRTMLRACNGPRQSERAADGWGGDAFAIGSRAGAGLLLWSTAWDSELDAQEFEQAVRTLAACWARDLGTRAGATAVLRSGANVAVTRGLAPGPAAALLPVLLSLPRYRPPAFPPMGSIALRQVPPAPPRHVPFVAGTRVVAPYFGLTLPIPAGFTPRLDEEVLLEQPDGAGTLMLLVSEWVVTPRTDEQLFSEFRESFRVAMGVKREQLTLEGETSMPTPLGPARARSWGVEGTRLSTRVVIVPVCQSTAALVLVESWADGATRIALDGVVGDLAPLGPGPPPMCSDLNP